MQDELAKIKQIKRYMNSRIVDRQSETHSLFLTLLADTSCLLLGPRGTSKTGHIRLFAQLMGLELFETLITPSTKPEQIFGPVDIPALAAGKVQYKISNHAPSADIMFLDEVFKANGLVLNPLLWLLNERIYRNGDLGIVHAPLLATFAASNEIPTDPDLAPVYDRFVIRHQINYLGNATLQQRMLERALQSEHVSEPPPTLTKEQVLSLRKQVRDVVVPTEVQTGIIRLRGDVKRTLGLEISDRRLVIAQRVVQAQALMRGRTEARMKDLAPLGTMFWDDPLHSVKAHSLVMYIADAITGDVATYETNAQSVYEVALKTGDLSSAIDKLSKIMEQTGKLSSSYGKRVHRNVGRLHSELVEMVTNRQTMLVLSVTDEAEGDWWKLVEASALLWSADQLRSVGFRQKRSGGYWWQPADSKKKFKKRVLNHLGVMVRFQTLY